MGDSQASKGSAEQGLGVVRHHTQSLRPTEQCFAVFIEAPGVRRRQAVPIQTIMLSEF